MAAFSGLGLFGPSQQRQTPAPTTQTGTAGRATRPRGAAPGRQAPGTTPRLTRRRRRRGQTTGLTTEVAPNLADSTTLLARTLLGGMTTFR